MKKEVKAVTALAIAVIILFLLFAGLGIISFAPNKHENANPSATQIPQTPPSSGPYVELDYKKIGWFYSTNTKDDLAYNYTYLVLSVNITNHQYSQVNLNGSNGFTVVINGNKYQPTPYPPLFLYNGSQTADHYTFPATLSETPLSENETLTGYVIFEFGNPTAKPSPAQIINRPFNLEYSVTYGNQTTSDAIVIINQLS